MATEKSKVALVTGANRGIGREISKQLAAKGFTVLMCGRDLSKVTLAAKSIPHAIPLQLDVDSESSIVAATQFAKNKVKQINVLVNNAGILIPDKAVPAAEITEELLSKTLKTNVIGVHLVTRHFSALLADNARIINISSMVGQLSGAFQYNLPYAVSKTALNMLTVQWAFALKSRGIAVNTISPGWVKTDMGGANAPGEVEDGADTAVWLASEAPQSLTGKFLEDRKEVDW